MPSDIMHDASPLQTLLMTFIAALPFVWANLYLSSKVSQYVEKSFRIMLFSHMMTSSNGNIFRVTGPLALCAGNSPVTGKFPSQRPVTRNFDVFFDLRLHKRLSEQPRRR